MTALQEVKIGARKTWSEGKYHALAQFLPPAAAHLVRVADVRPGDQVLDVACGTGVTAITAAVRGASVQALDLTPDLLEVAEAQAGLASVQVAWQEGDAEAMPYQDESFDVVLSSFGHMFTPDPEAVTKELLRVAKPGGTIAFATWPPDSVVGQMLKAVGALLKPPGPSPLMWGMEEVVTDRLGVKVSRVEFERGAVSWPTLSPGTLWHLFSSSYGPFISALSKLQDRPEEQRALAQTVQDVFARHIQDNVVPFEYLLTVATKA